VAETDRLLESPEVEEMTTLAVQTLRRMRMYGQGPPSFKLGGKVVYRESAVRQWIAEQEAAEQERLSRLHQAAS
jgi:predicted DNA-binding transcriptional regulator AlpA